MNGKFLPYGLHLPAEWHRRESAATWIATENVGLGLHPCRSRRSRPHLPLLPFPVGFVRSNFQ